MAKGADKSRYYPAHMLEKERTKADAAEGDYRPHGPRDKFSRAESGKRVKQLMKEIGYSLHAVAYYIDLPYPTLVSIAAGRARLPYSVQYALEQWAAYEQELREREG